MVVYNVYSQCVLYRYKTYLCSKATLVLVLISVLTVLFPVVFTYRSHGFWLRTDVYQEKPDISYKYDYLLIVDTAKQDTVFMCSNLPHLSKIVNNFNYCPILKAREEDFNRDGYNDLLKFSAEIILPETQAIHGITLLLFFDYKLLSHCRVQMEVVGVVQHSSPAAGSAVSVVADLSLMQRHPLDPRRPDTRYNTSVLPREPSFSLASVLHQYALRNVSARLTNVYNTWDTQPVAEEPFKVEVTVLYAEASVLYTPTTWQLLKSGWVQFFPVLFISVMIFRSIKNFIFSNQLVYTYKEVPWKKAY